MVKKAIIITSKLPVVKWYEFIGEATLTEAIMNSGVYGLLSFIAIICFYFLVKKVQIQYLACDRNYLWESYSIAGKKQTISPDMFSYLSWFYFKGTN